MTRKVCAGISFNLAFSSGRERSVSFESKFVSSPRGNLHILEQKGEETSPIFFTHGNSLCSSAYLPFLESLGKSGKTILSADIRGHGLSTAMNSLPLKKWDIFVDDVALVIEKEMHFPVTGIGHSMGGLFLCMAAARFPHLFSRLILLDPVIISPAKLLLVRCMQTLGIRNWFSLPRQTRKKRSHFPDRKSIAEYYKGKGKFRNWPEAGLEGFVRDGFRPSENENPENGGFDLSCAPELEARFYESVPTNTWNYIKKVQCPVYAVQANASRFFTRSAAELLQKRLVSGHLLVFEGAKHFFPLEQPEKSAKIVAEFIGD